MQLVQTRMRFGAPFTRAFTACRLTFQRRLVTLCACEILLPNCGPLPQTSHTCAISFAPNLGVFPGPPTLFSCGSHPYKVSRVVERGSGKLKTPPPPRCPTLYTSLTPLPAKCATS